MTAPPRMLLLDGGPNGGEAFVTMPTTYDKAIAAATEKFNIPKDTHIVRLTCNAAEMPYIGGYAGTSEIFITDNDSYHYACAGKHVARLNVRVFEKNRVELIDWPSGGGAKDGGGGGADGGKATSGGGSAGGGGGGGAAPASVEKTVEITIDCKKADGKQATVMGTVTGDMAKGPPAGEYLGTLSIAPNSLNQKFVGQQLGPNEVLTKSAAAWMSGMKLRSDIVHDKNTARLLFRPRSIRPKVDILYPEEKSLEVSMSVADWQVVAAYPMTSLIPDNGRQKLRWFLRVRPGGIIEDLLTGTEASGLFVELLPAVKARPDKPPGPEDPLVPAWPDVRPQNAWCLPQSIFVPHIDRVLTMLGLPVESRTAMITSWLPNISRHKNIAYRLLSPEQLAPSTVLNIIPAPQVLLRIFILFKGVADGDMAEWKDRGVVHAEMGLDWRSAIRWTPEVQNEEMFRVIEYGAMRSPIVEVVSTAGTIVAFFPLDFILKGGHPEWAYVIKALKQITDNPPDSSWSLVDVNGQPVPPEGTPQAGKYIYRNDYTTLEPTWARGPEYRQRYRPFVSGTWTSTVSDSKRSSEGQNSFRLLVAARDGTCLISDRFVERCTAYHIVPASRPDIYQKLLNLRTNNGMLDLSEASYGLLLGDDYHHMYDRLKFSLYHKDGSFFVHVFNPEGDIFSIHGVEIPAERFRGPDDQRPDPLLVEWHYQQCLMAHIRGFASGMTLPNISGSDAGSF